MAAGAAPLRRPAWWTGESAKEAGWQAAGGTAAGGGARSGASAAAGPAARESEAAAATAAVGCSRSHSKPAPAGFLSLRLVLQLPTPQTWPHHPLLPAVQPPAPGPRLWHRSSHGRQCAACCFSPHTAPPPSGQAAAGPTRIAPLQARGDHGASRQEDGAPARGRRAPLACVRVACPRAHGDSLPRCRSSTRSTRARPSSWLTSRVGHRAAAAQPPGGCAAMPRTISPAPACPLRRPCTCMHTSTTAHLLVAGATPAAPPRPAPPGAARPPCRLQRAHLEESAGGAAERARRGARQHHLHGAQRQVLQAERGRPGNPDHQVRALEPAGAAATSWGACNASWGRRCGQRPRGAAAPVRHGARAAGLRPTHRRTAAAPRTHVSALAPAATPAGPATPPPPRSPPPQAPRLAHGGEAPSCRRRTRVRISRRLCALLLPQRAGEPAQRAGPLLLPAQDGEPPGGQVCGGGRGGGGCPGAGDAGRHR
jgi:hypothetical protein